VALAAAGCASAPGHGSVTAVSSPSHGSATGSAWSGRASVTAPTMAPAVASAPGYSVPLYKIIADANAQVNHTTPPFHLAAVEATAPLPETTAERDTVSECNEGRGTRVLGAVLVTGPVSAGSPLYWAVFVDPPGKHIAPTSQPVQHPVTLNWIGAFVPVKNAAQPFCDYGHAADLPPLPILKS
jgi:hypothetical protein